MVCFLPQAFCAIAYSISKVAAAGLLWFTGTATRLFFAMPSSCLNSLELSMKSIKNFIGLCALALLPLQASATIIIDNTTLGLYNNGLGDLAAIDGPGGFLPGANVSEGDPTIYLNSDPLLPFTAAFGTNWLAGNYTGGTWSAGAVAIPSNWAINSETAIVYNFNLALASSLHIDLGVDNGVLVWLNGNFLFGATAPGGANINEYDFDVASLGAGNHALQILRADHGGGADFAISVDAKTLPRPVPEPGSLLLFALSLMGLGLARNRKLRR
jgi:hypothetical protein